MSVEFLPKVSAYRTAPLASEQAKQTSANTGNATINIQKRADGTFYAESTAGLSRFEVIHSLAKAGFAPKSMEYSEGIWSGTVRQLKPTT